MSRVSTSAYNFQIYTQKNYFKKTPYTIDENLEYHVALFMSQFPKMIHSYLNVEKKIHLTPTICWLQGPKAVFSLYSCFLTVSQ